MNDLKLIKKHYGEKMMQECRGLFSTILETEGLLFNILSKKFAYSKTLWDDITKYRLEYEFKNLIYGEVAKEELEKNKITKTPKELLSEAGYDLYECHSEEDIQPFRKYYYKTEKDYKDQFITKYKVPSYIGEEICTFNGGRLERAHVFFAVKKNVDEIKREDFKNPEREDEYGTSVISIQFSRDPSNSLSIKNRYNHTIKTKNPDATFSNNLDNIIPGLTEAFNQTYRLNVDSYNNNAFELPHYVKANDGKYYKYHHETNNTYYCSNNVIVYDFQPIYFDKSKYIVMENYIIDLKTKQIYSSYDEFTNSDHVFETEEEMEEFYRTFIPTDSYRENFNSYYSDTPPTDSFILSLGEINDIKIKVDKETKSRLITFNNGAEVTLDNDNNIIGYKNENITSIASRFLPYNTNLKNIELPNVEIIGNDFLTNNTYLKEISFPKLKRIYHTFLYKNKSIKEVNLPNLEKVGNEFLTHNIDLKYVILPKLKETGDNFMDYSSFVSRIIYMPNLEKVGADFFNFSCVQDIDLPKLKRLKPGFFSNNNAAINVNLPELSDIYPHFMNDSTRLRTLNLPKLSAWQDTMFDTPENANRISENADAAIILLRKNPNLEKVNLNPEIEHQIKNFVPDNIKELITTVKAK